MYRSIVFVQMLQQRMLAIVFLNEHYAVLRNLRTEPAKELSKDRVRPESLVTSARN